MNCSLNGIILACNGFLEWLEHHLLSCPSKAFFHYDCPGCGMQRSMLALFKGDLVQSLQLYPATIPIFILVAYTLLHLKFSFKNGAVVIKWMYVFCTVIVFGVYIYKIVTHKIF